MAALIRWVCGYGMHVAMCVYIEMLSLSHWKRNPSIHSVFRLVLWWEIIILFGTFSVISVMQVKLLAKSHPWFSSERKKLPEKCVANQCAEHEHAWKWFVGFLDMLLSGHFTSITIRKCSICLMPYKFRHFSLILFPGTTLIIFHCNPFIILPYNIGTFWHSEWNEEKKQSGRDDKVTEIYIACNRKFSLHSIWLYQSFFLMLMMMVMTMLFPR